MFYNSSHKTARELEVTFLAGLAEALITNRSGIFIQPWKATDQTCVFIMAICHVPYFIRILLIEKILLRCIELSLMFSWFIDHLWLPQVAKTLFWPLLPRASQVSCTCLGPRKWWASPTSDYPLNVHGTFYCNIHHNTYFLFIFRGGKNTITTGRRQIQKVIPDIASC